jgi:PAS domain S-box-containing protein
MSDPAFPWRVLSEPSLATHAAGTRPAWLWSADGRRLIWANPAGAAAFGARTCAAIAGRGFDPNHPAAAQIARIAAGLPVSGAPRLERLRGFGAGPGGTLTCLCARTSHDDMPAVLAAAIDAAGPDLPLAERARYLFDGCGEPVAVYSAHRDLLFATPEAQAQLAEKPSLPAADLAARTDRLGSGDNEMRVLRLQQAPHQTETQAETPLPAATEMIDLTPIADAIGEAQKAMAREHGGRAGDTAPARPQTSAERRHPMRFVWTIDPDNRFSIEPGDFIDLIGPGIAAELNRPWMSIASDLALDAQGAVARAVASRDTWSGVTIGWPVEDGGHIDVELAGLPVYDRDRNYRGYRGFGVCRDLTRIAALLAHRAERKHEAEAAADMTAATPARPAEPRPALSIVPASPNVVPFRPSSNDNRNASLEPRERNAFDELAARLSARLKGGGEDAHGESPAGDDAPADTVVPTEAMQPAAPIPQPAAPAKRDRPLLDPLPLGILVYRHAQFLYANAAFLRWTGHDSLQDFAEAGGLDTLFIAPQEGSHASALNIAAPREGARPASAHLHTIVWDDAPAMMLVTAETAQAAEEPASAPGAPPSNMQDLRAILDLAADGVVTLDRDGRILAANAGAERLFGYDAGLLTGLPFTNLFATSSEPLVRSALDRMTGETGARRDVTGRTRRGETLPLAMTLGAADADGETLCAVFQDLSRWKMAERELTQARRQAEAASAAKSEFLAKISHEIRTPLNAIIGFSDVMMNERFGPVGNERYREYLKDIHASGTHLVSLVNDLLDLSKIEAGKLDLAPEPVNLNDLTQQSVALMQPQASRERIIIRTSLAAQLPPIVADARSVRQIVLNLLSNSIKFTGAGGQVILSTARGDHGEAVLRVRDTGIGMSEKDIATALEPFRQLATAARPGSHGTGLGLPLTKALAEANSARFSIRSAVNAGTLVEIAFPPVRAAAE